MSWHVSHLSPSTFAELRADSIDLPPAGAGKTRFLRALAALTDRCRKPRSPLPFKKTDLARAIKSAKDAGLPLDRVEIDPSGRIVMIAASVQQQTQAAGAAAWDKATERAKARAKSPLKRRERTKRS